MIQTLLSSRHPDINLPNLYTYLWCLWKATNNALFGRKLCRPNQVHAAAKAIILGASLEETTWIEDKRLTQSDNQLQMSPYPFMQNSIFFVGTIISCDAAWSSATEKVGIGVIINMQDNQHCQQVQVSALAPPASSPLQAEAYGLHLAAKLADLMHIQEPRFHTDCSVLA
jgi:hypothetical protein